MYDVFDGDSRGDAQRDGPRVETKIEHRGYAALQTGQVMFDKPSQNQG